MFNALPNWLYNLFEIVPARQRARFEAWFNAPQFPRCLQIEQLFRCNLECVMCVHGISDPEPLPDMPLEMFKRIIDEFKGAAASAGFDRIEEIELQGIGEPMLHKDTIEMVRYANEHGIRTFFISNMTIMNEKLAEGLINAGHHHIIVSVDSIDAEVFQDIRRGVNFNVLEKVLKNIALVQRVKERLGSETPYFEVNSILMRRTVDQAPALVEKLRALGVRHIYFSDLISMGLDAETTFSDGSKVREQSLLDMDPAEVRVLMGRIKACETPACTVTVPTDWGGLGQRERTDAILTCDDLWEKPYVTTEGIVTPCCYLPDKNVMPMGDLREQRFEEIWFGEKYQQLRESHVKNDAPFLCKHCPRFGKTLARRSAIHGHDEPRYLPDTPIFLGDRRFATNVQTRGNGKHQTEAAAPARN